MSEQQVVTGAEALLPAILGGFKKQTQAQPSGLDGLGSLLDLDRDGDPLDDILRMATGGRR